jgi:hypothetical protein
MAKNDDVKAKIIAKAWKDPTFRKKLIAKPKETLKEMGYGVPANIEVRIEEDAAGHFTFVLPPAPTNVSELDEMQLKQIAAAAEISGLSPCICKM